LALSACGGTSQKKVHDGEAGESNVGGNGGSLSGGRGGTGAPPTGGFSGTHVDGGTGGFSGTAGQAGAGAVSGASPTMTRAEPTERGVRINFADTALAYELTCDSETSLVKANGERWIDERPPCNQPYYLDGVYESNVETFQCYGCDYISCEPFPASRTFSTVDYVQVGFRPAPNDEAEFGPRSGGEGGGAGAANEIPDVARRVYRGPLTLTIRYYTDDSCSSRLQIQPPVTFVRPRPSPS
jgi:hypothetical protein